MHAPFACESFATSAEPLLGLSLNITMTTLHDLVHQIPQVAKRDDLPRISGAAAMDSAMKDAVMRLAKCLHNETDAGILGPSIIREIIYRALQGEQASSLLALATRNSRFSQVAKAIDIIHRDYASVLDVDSTCRSCRYESIDIPSSFQKDVCRITPAVHQKNQAQ